MAQRPPAHLTAHHRRRRLMTAASSLAIIGTSALLAVAYFCLRTVTGQRWDDRAMSAVGAPTDVILNMLRGLSIVSVASTAVVMVLCMAVALLRARWTLAAAAAILVTGANISTQILKYRLFDRADLGQPNPLDVANSLPSGHTTVVTSLTLAAIIVSPARWRGLVVLAGSAMITLVGTSVVVARWHRPSDAVAAIAVCLAWAGIALTVAARFTRAPQERPRSAASVSYLLWGLLGPALVALLVDRVGLYAMGSLRSSALGALGLLAMGAAAWVTTVSVGLVARAVGDEADVPPAAVLHDASLTGTRS